MTKKFNYFPEFILLISFFVCILNLDLTEFNSEMSRSLSRALDVYDFKSSFYRLPGPIYDGYLLAAWSLTKSIEGLLFTQILIVYVSVYVFLKELKKNISNFSVCLVLLSFIFTPLFIQTIRKISSFSLSFGFYFLLTAFSLKLVRTRQSRWLAPCLLTAMMGLQLHLSVTIVLIAIALLLWVSHRFGLPSLPKNWLRTVLSAFLILAALTEVVINIEVYRNRKFYGRVSQTSDDEFSFTLRIKKSIYSLVNTTSTRDDPFQYFHGRALNRMRTEEMNSEQTETDFGLHRLLKGFRIDLQPDVKDKAIDNSWLFQLRTHQEMQMNPHSPYLLTELKADSFPQNLVIKYLNESLQGVEKIAWRNTGLILPFAFLARPDLTKLLRLEFDLLTKDKKFLNILSDSHYRILQVKINSKVQAPFETYPGGPGLQNQTAYKISDAIQAAFVVIEIRIETKNVPNFSRLDLFMTPYALASEKLR